MRVLLAILISLPLLGRAAEEKPLPRGDRVLSIDVNTPEKDDYNAAMTLIEEAGASALSLSVFWDDIGDRLRTVAPHRGSWEQAPHRVPAANIFACRRRVWHPSSAGETGRFVSGFVRSGAPGATLWQTPYE